YALADRHVVDLVHNALAHAEEIEAGPARQVPRKDPITHEGESTMASTQSLHAGHQHQHGPGCGHTGVKHDGHVDYLHDGHLHHPGTKGVEEHQLAVNKAN